MTQLLKTYEDILLHETDWNRNILWNGVDRMTFIAVEPTNFGIAPPDAENGSANEMEEACWQEYQADPEAFVANTVRDWWTLIDAVSQEANVIIMPTMPNTDEQKFYDQVFTADASLSMKNADGKLVTFFSNFSNEERRPEVDLHKAFMSSIDKILLERGLITKLPDRVFINMPYNFEGTGDCRWDYRGRYFAGYVENPGRKTASEGRSDIRSHDIIKRYTGAEIISLPTKKPFFHADTALLPASETPHILLHEDGFNNLNLKEFNKAAFGKKYDPKEFLIEISRFEADNMAANSVYIGNSKIVVPTEAGEGFAKKVAQAGMIPVRVPMGYTAKAGGAGHCMTNDIYPSIG